MGAGRLFVEYMLANGSVGLAFKKMVERLLFICTDVRREALNMDLALSVILDTNCRPVLLVRWKLTEQVKHEFVVNFNVGDPDGEVVIELLANLAENLVNGSRNHSSVFVV